MRDDIGYLFDIKSYSTHDGPGIRTTLFFSGCPLKCIWCHNPEAIHECLIWHKGIFRLHHDPEKCIKCLQCVNHCPTGGIKFTENEISIDNTDCSYCLSCVKNCPCNAIYKLADGYKIPDLIDLINKDIAFFNESGGGVTLSGGEPFYQKNFLLRLISELKKTKIDVFIDTSGYFQTELIDKISDVSLLYDLKVINDSKHFKYTGVSNNIILENLIKCDKNNINTIISIPLIPGLNTDNDDINDFVAFLKSLENIKKVRLLKYHDYAKNKYKKLGLAYKLDTITLKDVDKLYDSISKIFLSNEIDIYTGD